MNDYIYFIKRGRPRVKWCGDDLTYLHSGVMYKTKDIQNVEKFAREYPELITVYNKIEAFIKVKGKIDELQELP